MGDEVLRVVEREGERRGGSGLGLLDGERKVVVGKGGDDDLRGVMAMIFWYLWVNSVHLIQLFHCCKNPHHSPDPTFYSPFQESGPHGLNHPLYQQGPSPSLESPFPPRYR